VGISFKKEESKLDFPAPTFPTIPINYPFLAVKVISFNTGLLSLLLSSISFIPLGNTFQ